jgi:hypothetical protein
MGGAQSRTFPSVCVRPWVLSSAQEEERREKKRKRGRKGGREVGRKARKEKENENAKEYILYDFIYIKL